MHSRKLPRGNDRSGQSAARLSPNRGRLPRNPRKIVMNIRCFPVCLRGDPMPSSCFASSLWVTAGCRFNDFSGRFSYNETVLRPVPVWKSISTWQVSTPTMRSGISICEAGTFSMLTCTRRRFSRVPVTGKTPTGAGTLWRSYPAWRDPSDRDRGATGRV